MTMQKVFERPKALAKVQMSYCAGCLHSVVHRLIAELIDEMDLMEKTVGICPVGCSVFMYDFMECDMIEASHGRAPAVATGVKRMLPDNFVFAYQGDGDLASIGTAETVHAAARGENISIIFINNGTYGMTGGQMAPTTLIGEKATTCPNGRDPKTAGYPIKVCELLSSLDGPSYIARVAPVSAAGLNRTKAAIKKAFQKQLDGKGFSLVEVLSNCPTHWHMSPIDSFKWIEETATVHYPLGEFVDR